MKSSADFKVTAGLLALALAVGGAGLSHPLLAMLLRLSACGAAAYLILTRRDWRFDRLTSSALALLALVLLLPLAQLVPLPPSVWTQLPGREVARDLDSVLGVTRWRPLTLDVEGTIQSFLSLVPAAALFICALFLPLRQRVRLYWVIVGFALFGAILGVMQFATGGGLTPFPSGHSGYAIGLFVNRNHSAAFSLAAMPLAAALGTLMASAANRRVPSVIAVVSSLLAMATAVLATTSRMGILLLPFAIAAALFLTFYRQPPWKVALPSLLGVLGVGLLLLLGGGFNHTLQRFSSLDDPRLDYWTDIYWALQHYGLAGTGFGTFMPVYQSAESLEALGPALVNHAHNDYLEIILEGGLPAILIALLFLAILGTALWRSARTRRLREPGVVTVAATCGLAILLVSSLVDYPLRMPAISCMFAVLFSILLSNRGTPASLRQELVPYDTQRGHVAVARTKAHFLALVPIAAVALVTIQDGMASRALIADQHESAAEWAPWSTRAHEQLATDLLLQGQSRAAANVALSAVALSPIDAGAIRTLGMVRMMGGARTSGERLMGLAVVLGWRDMLTQLWTIQRAERSRETDKALQRAEALFRQEHGMLPALVQLLDSPDSAGMVPKLAAMLANRPPWRGAFFDGARGLPSEQTPQFGQLLSALGDSKAPVSSEELRPVLTQLIASGASEEARRLWNASRKRGLLSNAGFERAEERANAFAPVDWEIPRASRKMVSVPAIGPAHGRVLRIVKPAGSGSLVSQELMLGAGDYVLSYRARVSGAPRVVIHWEMRCADSAWRQSAIAQLPGDGDWHSQGSSLAVPQRHCPIQTLELKIPVATPEAEILIDEVTLKAEAH